MGTVTFCSGNGGGHARGETRATAVPEDAVETGRDGVAADGVSGYSQRDTSSRIELPPTTETGLIRAWSFSATAIEQPANRVGQDSRRDCSDDCDGLPGPTCPAQVKSETP
jgi:hypothetical protein